MSDPEGPVVNFATSEYGGTSATAPAPGLGSGQQMAINGSTDLSSIVCTGTDSDAGFVNWITLLMYQTDGGEHVNQLQINGQGPSGFESGWLVLVFTDAADQTHTYTIFSSSLETHTFDYSSNDPNILAIQWYQQHSEDDEAAA